MVISIIVFKRTVEYHTYKDMDSKYMEVLKIDLDHLNWDPDWIASYTNKEPEERLRYEQYMLTWNIIEIIFDRRTIDKTYILVIILEKKISS